ncbi:MAG: hypothetical protein P4L90_10400 [Rhodopila sp.]|nr:hypothetical protein [Rhodopila sp.]
MTVPFQFPWDTDPAPIVTPAPPDASNPAPKRRGRRPIAPTFPSTNAAPAWLWHHLTISGPAADVAAFADAARGPGVIPWHLDYAQIEEDIFHRAVAGRGGPTGLSIEGCHILARQFRQRIESRDEKAVALIGQGRACPFDLHVLLPIPAEILQRGPTDPQSLDWLARHWGTRDPLRKIVARPNPSAGRRLPGGHAVISYGFFSSGETPRAVVTQFVARWPRLRFLLTPLPAG